MFTLNELPKERNKPSINNNNNKQIRKFYLFSFLNVKQNINTQTIIFVANEKLNKKEKKK